MVPRFSLLLIIIDTKNIKNLHHSSHRKKSFLHLKIRRLMSLIGKEPSPALTILHWNIENGGDKDNKHRRLGAIKVIIDKIIQSENPEFISIAEFTKDGPIQSATVHFDESLGKNWISDSYHRYYAKCKPKRKQLAVLAREKELTPFALSDHKITFDKTNKNPWQLNFLHWPNKFGRTAGFSTLKIPQSIAIGDFNKGNDYISQNFGCYGSLLEDLTHSRSNNVTKINFSINDIPTLTEQPLDRIDFIKTGKVDYTLIQKLNKTKPPIYSGSGWNDFFVTSESFSKIELTHYNYDSSLIAGNLEGKANGIAPSNHIPILVKFFR